MHIIKISSTCLTEQLSPHHCECCACLPHAANSKSPIQTVWIWPGGLFFLLWQCVSLICAAAVLWVDTEAHTISRHCCIANRLADTCRSDDKKRTKFPLLEWGKRVKIIHQTFARREVNNVLFMQRIEPRVRIHRGGRTGAGWLEVCGERRKRMGEKVAGKRQTNKLEERKENNKIMQEWGKKGRARCQSNVKYSEENNFLEWDSSLNNLQLQSASTWGQ